MDLRHLRYFLALAEEGHFGRAAERLHIVQPALSMQIRALEEELGGPLFLRTSRRVELTDAGQVLMIEARRTLAQAEQTQLLVRQTIRGEIGRVRVGFAGNAVLSGKLKEDLRLFHRTYPSAQLIVREVVPQLQAAAILAGELDVGYAPALGSPLPAALKGEQIGTWRVIAALASDHRLADNARLTARMIAAEPLILYAETESDVAIQTVLREVFGREPNVAHRVGSTLGVLALAAAGLGVALVPTPLNQVVLPDLIYKPVDIPKLAANLILISREQETSGAVTAFLRLARSRADQAGS